MQIYSRCQGGLAQTSLCEHGENWRHPMNSAARDEYNPERCRRPRAKAAKSNWRDPDMKFSERRAGRPPRRVSDPQLADHAFGSKDSTACGSCRRDARNAAHAICARTLYRSRGALDAQFDDFRID